MIEHGETRLLQLGVNNTLITLRAISHHAAMYWVKGLQTLQSGTLLCIDSERSTFGTFILLSLFTTHMLKRIRRRGISSD